MKRPEDEVFLTHGGDEVTTDLTVKKHVGTKRGVLRFLVQHFFQTLSFIISFYHFSPTTAQILELL
jgi:hypothetical protein